MRHLASVQRITALDPIEGKDRIVLARVLGWNVIVQKDMFNVGDLCVYCEIDSVLPEKPEFEFLRSKNFRIKTIKMGGVYSQGICFPLSILPKKTIEQSTEIKLIEKNGEYRWESMGWKEGDDVTDIIGVKQYEPEMDDPVQSDEHLQKKKNCLMRFKWYRKLFKKSKRKDGFPSFISKTDEVRIQTAPQMLQDRTEPYVFTEKLDGSSATYALRRLPWYVPFKCYEFYVCSRNRRLVDRDDSVYWRIADECHIEEGLKQLLDLHFNCKNFICIQGEIIGPKIQGNPYKLTNLRFYAFNLVIDGERQQSIYAADLLSQLTWPIDFVPFVGIPKALPASVDEMMEMSNGMSQIANVPREGLVVRGRYDSRKSFKAVSPEYLAKKKG